MMDSTLKQFRKRSVVFLAVLCMILVSVVPAGARTDSPLGQLSSWWGSLSSSNNPETLSEFAALFETHTDSLEDSFKINCSRELQNQLFSDSCISGQDMISQIKNNSGMLRYSYYQNSNNLELVNCRYYEGKRIVHAWRNHQEYNLTAREKETLEAAVRMTEGIRGSDLEREKAVHDLLCRQVTYYTDPSTDEHQECDCAVGALLNGRADCDGYSDAFFLLASLVGLEVRYQHGDAVPDSNQEAPEGNERNLESGGHMWNLVRIDEKWVMVDVTWDDLDEDGIFYTYFNTGTSSEVKKHIWESQTLSVSIEPTVSNDLRPAELGWTDVSNLTELYNALRTEIGLREQLCLRYPDSFDLNRYHHELSNEIYSAGVENFQWHFGANCVEIAGISLAPHYRICDSEAAALSYIDECASSGIRSFAIYFSPDIAPAMFANDHARIRRLLSNSRLESTGYQYNEENRRVIISDASWLPALRTFANQEELFSYLDVCLSQGDSEIHCLLADSIDFNRIADAIWDKVYSMGVDQFQYSVNGPRLSILSISYYPEYRIVSSREEILSYLRECRSRRPLEIRIYCTQSLYTWLHANNADEMFSLMAEAGLQQKNLYHNDSYSVYIISPPEW